MTSTPAWLSLVVDERQPARAEGALLRFAGGHCLVGPGGVVRTSGGAIASLNRAVQLQPIASTTDLTQFEGHRVLAHGHLNSGVLFVAQVEQFPGEPDLHYLDVSAASQPHPITNQPRPAIEQAQMRDGLLLNLWHRTTSDGVHQLALATDVNAVRTALLAHYGNDLTVIQSRWTAATLQDIERDLADTHLAQSIGTRISDDNQLQVTAVLLHVPASLPPSLAHYPATAIDIHPILAPAHA